MLLSQLSLPVIIGILLILYGARLEDEFTDQALATVGKWTISGVLALFLVGQWYAFLDWYIDQVTTLLVFFAAVTTGVFFGALIGIHAARVHRSKEQLADQNERLESSREQLADQNERLEEFTSMVSHDLRNPLQTTMGFLELAEDTGEQDYFDRCKNQVDRMNRLIDDMLTLARADEDSIDLDITSITGTAQRGWDTLDTGDATLVLNENIILEADSGQIDQLVKNLIKNALDHAGADATVTIGALEERTGFYIADDGPGIPAEKRDRIFQHGYTTGNDGTGYGLTIVARVVDVHGWEITITESEGGGARFEIYDVDEVADPVDGSLDQHELGAQSTIRSRVS